MAKALILQTLGTELEKYLDVPAFERGALSFIQKLIATLELSTLINGTQLYLPMIIKND